MTDGQATKLGFAGIVLSLVGPFSANLRLIPPFVGFLLFFAGALIALAGALMALVQLLKHKRLNGPAFLGFIPLMLVMVFFSKARAFPPINDVSTDLNDVPQFVRATKLRENVGRDMSFPDAFKPIVRTHYGDLSTITVGETPDALMDKTVALLKQKPFFELTREDREAKEIEGTAETSFFKFKDDFIVRFRPVGQSTQIDMRSKSRNGKGDVGANAIRIRMLFAAIQKGEW